jgi:hypothetical protein
VWGDETLLLKRTRTFGRQFILHRISPCPSSAVKTPPEKKEGLYFPSFSFKVTAYNVCKEDFWSYEL